MGELLLGGHATVERREKLPRHHSIPLKLTAELANMLVADPGGGACQRRPSSTREAGADPSLAPSRTRPRPLLGHRALQRRATLHLPSLTSSSFSCVVADARRSWEAVDDDDGEMLSFSCLPLHRLLPPHPNPPRALHCRPVVHASSPARGRRCRPEWRRAPSRGAAGSGRWVSSTVVVVVDEKKMSRSTGHGSRKPALLGTLLRSVSKNAAWDFFLHILSLHNTPMHSGKQQWAAFQKPG